MRRSCGIFGARRREGGGGGGGGGARFLVALCPRSTLRLSLDRET